ncbi:MAG: DUF924 domain-containing protein [Burkholderiaceae bacterium]|nr:DUF924 domain-containing protein [Burkholderiaceae bacterium]
MTAPHDVLDFWFGAPGSPEYGRARALWFEKSKATDDEIRTRFGAAVEAALQGAFDDWRGTPRGALALILLLDQFTRNVFRDTPRAFAGDARALSTAQAMVERGDDRALTPYERQFAYLPFEHAEDRAAQEISLRLFTQLARDGLPEALEWARRHYDVIARFGRYPHRNAILERESTPEEIAFLRQPGSRF